MEPLEEEEEEEEEEVEEQENVDGEEELPQKTKKKKRVKRGPRGLWKQDLVDDLVDIIITNDYYPRKLIFVNTIFFFPLHRRPTPWITVWTSPSI